MSDEPKIVDVEIRKTGEILFRGRWMEGNQQNFTVEKTYPNGAKAGVTFFTRDAEAVDVSPNMRLTVARTENTPNENQ